MHKIQKRTCNPRRTENFQQIQRNLCGALGGKGRAPHPGSTRFSKSADLGVLIALGVCNQSVCSARSIQDRRLEVLSVEESHEILAPEMRVIEALTTAVL